MVNLWPRPIQQPHPPVWIPGSSSTTVDYVAEHGHSFCHLSYFGAKNSETLGDYWWETVVKKGGEPNPYRLGFLQLVGVSETDAAAEEYARHVEYFFHKCLYTPAYYQNIPGCQDYASLQHAMKAPLRERADFSQLHYKDFVERGYLVAGSPATVRDRLLEGVKRLRVGHLLLLLHFGSMSHELCLKNIDLFCREVLPDLQDLWDDQWEDHWWPERLRAPRPVVAASRGES